MLERLKGKHQVHHILVFAAAIMSGLQLVNVTKGFGEEFINQNNALITGVFIFLVVTTLMSFYTIGASVIDGEREGIIKGVSIGLFPLFMNMKILFYKNFHTINDISSQSIILDLIIFLIWSRVIYSIIMATKFDNREKSKKTIRKTNKEKIIEKTKDKTNYKKVNMNDMPLLENHEELISRMEYIKKNIEVLNTENRHKFESLIGVLEETSYIYSNIYILNKKESEEKVMKIIDNTEKELAIIIENINNHYLERFDKIIYRQTSKLR